MSIGIFDSGIGGLTVFKSLAALLPHEDLLYLGDTARVPYGTKSSQTVTRYAHQNVRFLLKQNVKMIVVACNTVSAFALGELQKGSQTPVVGVIEPGVEGAVRQTFSKKIGVIGTEGTVASGVYEREIQKRLPGAEVLQVPCPLFVPLAEEGMTEGEIPLSIARKYLSDVSKSGIDTLILGCTHYPLLKTTIRKAVGDKITLIDSAQETARAVQRLLEEKNLSERLNRPPKHSFYVTDHPERFRKVGSAFLGTPIPSVELVDV